jgi:hypothetical protein
MQQQPWFNNIAPNIDPSTRGAIVTMKAWTNKPTVEIVKLFSITPNGVKKIYTKAIKRGLNLKLYAPNPIKVEYVVDAPKSSCQDLEISPPCRANEGVAGPD